MSDHLDAAYHALRAWCHERPLDDDAGTAYKTFGAVSSIIPALQVIVDLANNATARATGSDDGRTVADAHDEVHLATHEAIRSLDDVRLAVSQAHQTVSHLVFALDDPEPSIDQEPLPRPPANEPVEVQRALDSLRQLTPEIEERESRTLAEIADAERAADPLHQLEARADHLRSLADRAHGGEAAAVAAELADVTAELRAARQNRRLDRTLGRPQEPGGARTDTWTKARDARVKTLTHDTLAGQSDWVLDELHRLHTSGELTSLDPRALANQLVANAVERDGGSPAVPPTIPPPARWIAPC